MQSREIVEGSCVPHPGSLSGNILQNLWTHVTGTLTQRPPPNPGAWKGIHCMWLSVTQACRTDEALHCMAFHFWHPPFQVFPVCDRGVGVLRLCKAPSPPDKPLSGALLGRHTRPGPVSPQPPHGPAHALPGCYGRAAHPVHMDRPQTLPEPPPGPPLGPNGTGVDTGFGWSTQDRNSGPWFLVWECLWVGNQPLPVPHHLCAPATQEWERLSLRG